MTHRLQQSLQISIAMPGLPMESSSCARISDRFCFLRLMVTSRTSRSAIPRKLPSPSTQSCRSPWVTVTTNLAANSKSNLVSLLQETPDSSECSSRVRSTQECPTSAQRETILPCPTVSTRIRTRPFTTTSCITRSLTWPYHPVRIRCSSRLMPTRFLRSLLTWSDLMNSTNLNT